MLVSHSLEVLGSQTEIPKSEKNIGKSGGRRGY